MKKTILFLSLMLTLLIWVGCSGDSNNGVDVTETKMTLKIESKLYNASTGSSATIIQYYQAVNIATNESFLIPVNDVLGFEYHENYSYVINVVCVQSIKDGVPFGNPWFKLESVVSKTYEPEGPVDPIPTPTGK